MDGVGRLRTFWRRLSGSRALTRNGRRLTTSRRGTLHRYCHGCCRHRARRSTGLRGIHPTDRHPMDSHRYYPCCSLQPAVLRDIPPTDQGPMDFHRNCPCVRQLVALRDIHPTGLRGNPWMVPCQMDCRRCYLCRSQLAVRRDSHQTGLHDTHPADWARPCSLVDRCRYYPHGSSSFPVRRGLGDLASPFAGLPRAAAY
jgi:hypothetical protein